VLLEDDPACVGDGRRLGIEHDELIGVHQHAYAEARRPPPERRQHRRHRRQHVGAELLIAQREQGRRHPVQPDPAPGGKAQRPVQPVEVLPIHLLQRGPPLVLRQ
jgi:hypothetical protein